MTSNLKREINVFLIFIDLLHFISVIYTDKMQIAFKICREKCFQFLGLPSDFDFLSKICMQTDVNVNLAIPYGTTRAKTWTSARVLGHCAGTVPVRTLLEATCVTAMKDSSLELTMTVLVSVLV